MWTAWSPCENSFGTDFRTCTKSAISGLDVFLLLLLAKFQVLAILQYQDSIGLLAEQCLSYFLLTLLLYFLSIFYLCWFTLSDFISISSQVSFLFLFCRQRTTTTRHPYRKLHTYHRRLRIRLVGISPIFLYSVYILQHILLEFPSVTSLASLPF